jgi:O-antigen/teichoic acid export membrane protein
VYRQILGYIPSNIVPAFVSMLMVYAYTRLMSPEAFGAYSYVFSAVLILQTSLFYALPIAVLRFYPGAALAGRREGLLKEAYVVFYVSCAITIVVALVAGGLITFSDTYRGAALLAVPMLLLRSLVQLNQAVNRSSNAMGRYNTVECLHAVLGFALGGILLLAWDPSAESIVLGLLIAALVCAAIDVRLLGAPFRPSAGTLNRAELVRLVEYAWPMVAVAATAMILQNSDRFLLGSISGAGALGIFAVAYNLVDRPTTVICNSISTTTFPLAVQVLEQQGRDAARIQAGRNGIALLAATLPACFGLAFCSDYIAASLIGEAFRPGVAALLPIMAFTALARGLRAHFIDHAFHLSGRPLAMLWTYVPATVVNVALNLYIVPRYGMFGAAWTALLCHSAIVVSGWFLGTSLFPVWLPVGQVLRCLIAVVPMSAALYWIRFQQDWFGLISAISMGGAIYVLTAFVLDVGEMRTLALRRWRNRLQTQVPALTDV